MEVIIQHDPQSASAVAARIISHTLREKPDAVLGLATGSTPILLYNELVRMHRAGYLDFSRATTFNLDEYVGLQPQHPASYQSFMFEHLFNHINIKRENINIPNGLSDDIPNCCRAYEEKIKACGGIDMQILGIGTEGHIGFNEPTSSLGSRTRIKTLTPRTRFDNAPYFGSEAKVPKHVITTGIGTIMEAKAVLLLAFGENKADAVAGAVEGPISASNPASILQMHPTAKIYLDENSASKLARRDYYRWVFDHKPGWQRD